MSTKITSKINRLVQNWPRGTAYTQTWLTSQGYNANLMRRYRESCWVKAIGNGAYILSNDQLEWPGGLYALQTQLNLPVHAGGRTALEHIGAAHYTRFHETKIFLFALPQIVLPKWYLNYNWEAPLLFHSSRLLPYDITDSFTEMKHRDFAVRISAAERAILEMLYLVPIHQGFDEAFKIMEGLMTLRPQLMQKLLEYCNSIKVKRLFLYMAEKNQIPVFDRLDQNRIDLGQGKRSIIKNGFLDKKYQITIPKEYA
jgi:hypothetical protein